MTDQSAILAIDPGTYESGWVLVCGKNGFASDGSLLRYGKAGNDDLVEIMLEILLHHRGTRLVIEKTEPHRAVNREILRTVWWEGVFSGIYDQSEHSSAVFRIPRKDVRVSICGIGNANDAMIRDAMLEHFGPIGKKGSEGPLYGMKQIKGSKNDIFSAMAIAKTLYDNPHRRDEWREKWGRP